EPLLILLDEPFTGIDPITIADIRQIVRDLRNTGIGVLLTDHNVREALKITDRSYLIKDGKVRTHGSPQEIIRDPIAINEYLGQGFNEDFLIQPPAGQATAPLPAPTLVQPPEEPTVHQVLELERIHRLIERLKTDDHMAATRELLERGSAAVPGLMEALERRDVDLRAQAHLILQQILGRPVAFDPYAPEALRRQQIAGLREQVSRKAG